MLPVVSRQKTTSTRGFSGGACFFRGLAPAGRARARTAATPSTGAAQPRNLRQDMLRFLRREREGVGRSVRRTGACGTGRGVVGCRLAREGLTAGAGGGIAGLARGVYAASRTCVSP